MSEEQPPVLPGVTIQSKLGEGGMSTVYLAYDRRRGIPVAVKILNPDLTKSEEDLEKFATESRMMETIDHEGIVKSYGLRMFDGKIYYLMEFVDGYSFGDFLAKKHHLREEDCLLICESVASALDYAWNNFGVVHCDIKPDNIMINSQGVVKVTDLGLGRTFRFLKEGQVEVPDHVMGTPAYISPEQVFGDVQIDCRADIYSLAASLYHLSTGRVLFPGMSSAEMMRAHCDNAMMAADPRTYRPELSLGFCQMLEAMLVKDRSARIQTWQDVYSMCRDVSGGVEFAMRDTSFPSSMRIG